MRPRPEAYNSKDIFWLEKSKSDFWEGAFKSVTGRTDEVDLAEIYTR